MIVAVVIAVPIVLALLAAWLYDRRHPGALFNGSVIDLESDMAQARREAARNDGFYDRERGPSDYDQL